MSLVLTGYLGPRPGLLPGTSDVLPGLPQQPNIQQPPAFQPPNIQPNIQGIGDIAGQIGNIPGFQPSQPTGPFTGFDPSQIGLPPGLVPPGGFQPPPVQGIDVTQLPGFGGAPQGPSYADIVSGAQAGVSQLPGFQSFVPDIQRLADQQSQAFLQSLEPLFGQQREAERERLISRGLLGSGPETEALRRLTEAQSGQAAQGLSAIQTQALQSIVQERQQGRQLEEQRFQNAQNLATQLGISQQEIESRFGLQLNEISAKEAMQRRELEQVSFLETQAANLEAAGLFNQANSLRIQAAELNQLGQFREASLNLDRDRLQLDARGQQVDELLARGQLEEAAARLGIDVGKLDIEAGRLDVERGRLTEEQRRTRDEQIRTEIDRERKNIEVQAELRMQDRDDLDALLTILQIVPKDQQADIIAAIEELTGVSTRGGGQEAPPSLAGSATETELTTPPERQPFVRGQPSGPQTKIINGLQYTWNQNQGRWIPTSS